MEDYIIRMSIEMRNSKINNDYVILTVKLAWISILRPFLDMKRHVNSSTVAVIIWKVSWVLGNTASSFFISCFRLCKQAIFCGD